MMCSEAYIPYRYSNSFITMLNNRRKGSAGGGPDDSVGGSQNESYTLERRPQWSAPSRQLAHAKAPSVAVAIHTETAIRLDNECPNSRFDRDSLPKRSVLDIA